MKQERSKVDFPVWRKKVDGALFNHKGTTIPNWVCKMWDIEDVFSETASKKHENSKVTIIFDGKRTDGWITVAKHGRPGL